MQSPNRFYYTWRLLFLHHSFAWCFFFYLSFLFPPVEPGVFNCCVTTESALRLNFRRARRVFALRNRNDPCGAQAAGVVPNIGDLWLSIMYGRLDGVRHKAWSGSPRPQANPRPLDVCRTAGLPQNTDLPPSFYTST